MAAPTVSSRICICGISLLALLTYARATWAASPEFQGTNDPILIDIAKGSTAADHAVKEIQSRIKHQVPMTLWRDWLPALMYTHHYQEVVDFATAGEAGRTGLDAIEPLAEFRAKALLMMGKHAQALEAAKSYYNVCQLKNTANAVALVAQCLECCHPEDSRLATRFRSEQAIAGCRAADAAAGTDRKVESTPALEPILQTIHIDSSIYNEPITAWAEKSRFSDRAGYANLLLLADRCDEAEKVFRDLFQAASSQQELNLAMDGIARTLRAEDSNVTRADIWLLTLRQSAVAGATGTTH